MSLLDELETYRREGAPAFARFEAKFIAPEVIERDDVPERFAKLAKIISGQIIPQLALLHSEGIAQNSPVAIGPTDAEIQELAHIVVGPDIDAAAAYVSVLRDKGLAMETLFIQLLAPCARHLGEMWDRDECSFIDVTLGVGRLQSLLSIFNCTFDIPALDQKRKIVMSMTPGDQHFFGGSVVEKFLRASGWFVEHVFEATVEHLAATVSRDWFAVAGFTLGSEGRLDTLKETIQAVRSSSSNADIGIIVGGPMFNDRPELVSYVGADETAINAPAAVLVAQKLFDLAALKALGHRSAI